MNRHLRRRLRRPHVWLRSRLAPRAAVLMYHGVGEVDIDPWGLFVTPEHFAQHVEVLGATATPMGLGELADACRTGTVPSRAVAVTIDDGYANILHRAKPILEAAAVPATLFAIGRPLHDATEYWWDELAGVVLTPGRLPPTLELSVTDRRISIDLGPAEHYTETQWRLDHRYRDEESRAGDRMRLYRQLWQLLMPLEDEVRDRTLAELARWAGCDRPRRETHRSMSIDELVDFDGELTEVGGHTSTHPLLPDQPADRQRLEIEQNKKHLEAVLDRPVENFSYPFGAHDSTSVAAARAAGYKAAVIARPETATASTDPLRIGRFDVKDWPVDRFERQLDRWLRYQ